jgi:hypothetical protein
MYSSLEIKGCISLKIYLCVLYRYMLEMVDHLIIINVHTRTINGMELITFIYVRRDVLFKSKLLHNTVRAMHLDKLKKYEWDN